MTHSTDPARLKEAISRLTALYWDALRNGGPDVELDDPYSLSIVYPLETHRTKKLLS